MLLQRKRASQSRAVQRNARNEKDKNGILITNTIACVAREVGVRTRLPYFVTWVNATPQGNHRCDSFIANH